MNAIRIADTAQCVECRAFVDVIYLISNHAGGAANACELIVCSACVEDVLDRAAYVLGQPIERLEHNGHLVDAQVFVSDDLFVKACQVDVATAMCV